MEHALSRHLAGKFDSAIVYPEVFPIERDDLMVSLGNGNGQQMIYIYQEHIGDTLEVIGYYSDYVLDSVNFIVY